VSRVAAVFQAGDTGAIGAEIAHLQAALKSLAAPGPFDIGVRNTPPPTTSSPTPIPILLKDAFWCWISQISITNFKFLYREY